MAVPAVEVLQAGQPYGTDQPGVGYLGSTESEYSQVGQSLYMHQFRVGDIGGLKIDLANVISHISDPGTHFFQLSNRSPTPNHSHRQQQQTFHVQLLR
ncbi:MAG: hypothetical protein VX346_17070 [Planctomycetota bacterium]|nr:hypothetical protein [Planctomycetota bacterium]